MYHLHDLYYLSHLSTLKVAGPLATNLLQGQLTVDVPSLQPFSAKLAAHCNAKGRIISLSHLFCDAEKNYYMIMPVALIPLALAALQKYAAFYRGTELCAIATLLLGTCSKPDPAVLLADDSVIALPYFKDAHIIMRETTSIPRSSLDFSEFHRQTLRALIPAIYPNTSEKFLPHECGLHELNVIDYHKGCYTGQEIIARMQYRGKIKRKSYLARIAKTDLVAGMDVFAEQPPRAIGQLIDALAIDQHEALALLSINAEDAKAQHVSIEQHYFTFI